MPAKKPSGLPRKRTAAVAAPAPPADNAAWQVVAGDVRAQFAVFFDAMEARFREVRADLQGMDERLSRKLESLEAAVRQNSTDIGELKAAVEQNSKDIRENSADIRENAADIRGKLERMGERVSTLESRRR